MFVIGCDRPECTNTNPIFENYSPEEREYKDELAKQLATVDKSKLTYWMDSYQEENNSKHINVHVQGDKLCAKIVLKIDNLEKGIEGIIKSKGGGYKGAELENLQFETIQNGFETEFIFQEISGIVD